MTNSNVPSTWETDEDFERDLILYAEYCVPKKNAKPVRVPRVILQFRKMMANNKKSRLLDDFCDISTDESFDVLELSAHQIRKVLGVGYSNSLVEEYINSASSSSDSGFSSAEESFHFIKANNTSAKKNMPIGKNVKNYYARRKNYLPNN